MATKTARCPVETFEHGRLPMVCAVSGEPADGWYSESYPAFAAAVDAQVRSA